MTVQPLKLGAAVLLAVTLVVAILLENDNEVWAVPLLALLIGYVVGNAQVTENAPIIKKP